MIQSLIRSSQSALGLMIIVLGLHSTTSRASQCPIQFKKVIDSSHKLILVNSANESSTIASWTFWERARLSESFVKDNTPSTQTLLGKKGIGWGYDFQSLALPGEAIKKEGDKKTPRGIYPIAELFGFAESQAVNYLQLKSDTQCVDDPASQFYNRIVNAFTRPRDWNSAENMRAIGQYEIGALIDYDSNAAASAGSCIFFHIWENPTTGTSGCVASSRQNLEFLHQWMVQTPSSPKLNSAVAILTNHDMERFAGCFSGILSLENDNKLVF